MGWWNQTPDGASLWPVDTGLQWGDGPADVMDGALRDIAAQFVQELGRKPTDDELLAGLRFSLPGFAEGD